jgi:hypothetical protein
MKRHIKQKYLKTAEYLNTKYTEDQFAHIVKSHKSNQPNTKSTLKTAAKIAE